MDVPAAWQASLLDDATVGTEMVRLGGRGGRHPATGGDVGADAEVAVRDWSALRRHHLAEGAWLDHLDGWLLDAGSRFVAVRDRLPWAEGTERIRGDDVRRPRLTARLRLDEVGPDLAWLATLGRELGARYGVTFTRIGCNLYRHGSDSVAWHGDRVVRDLPTSTIAIVSLGEPRPFRYRPAAGGASAAFALGQGDLLVMGGSFQRTWRHAVPKVRRAGPRISVTFRTDLPPAPGASTASGP
jgi:hypothetical protein